MKETGRLDGRPVHYLAVAESTNSTAMAMAKQGAAPGLAVVAESQSKGRGRLSRSWLSPAGQGLYFSILYRPRLGLNDLAKITLAAGLAVARAVDRLCGCSIKLKWPNDLVLNGKKCGGILTECEMTPGHDLPAVVIGIGLNVTTTADYFPSELHGKATSLLLETDKILQKSDLLRHILTELDRLVTALEQGGFADILAAWKERDFLAGRKLTWVTARGQAVNGISLGPDREGLLHIRDAHGRVHEVLSGDLSLVEE